MTNINLEKYSTIWPIFKIFTNIILELMKIIFVYSSQQFISFKVKKFKLTFEY